MTHVNRKTRGTHEIVGCIVLPGLQWAKYLVRVANGTYEIMYEGDLMDVCRPSTRPTANVTIEQLTTAFESASRNGWPSRARENERRPET